MGFVMNLFRIQVGRKYMQNHYQLLRIGITVFLQSSKEYKEDISFTIGLEMINPKPAIH